MFRSSTFTKLLDENSGRYYSQSLPAGEGKIKPCGPVSFAAKAVTRTLINAKAGRFRRPMPTSSKTSRSCTSTFQGRLKHPVIPHTGHTGAVKESPTKMSLLTSRPSWRESSELVGELPRMRGRAANLQHPWYLYRHLQLPRPTLQPRVRSRPSHLGLDSRGVSSANRRSHQHHLKYPLPQ